MEENMGAGEIEITGWRKEIIKIEAYKCRYENINAKYFVIQACGGKEIFIRDKLER